MEANGYHEQQGHEKCQCITFDENGRIIGSCDTLFAVPRPKTGGQRASFPFLEKIINHFKESTPDTDPLFIPQVEFEYNGYYSVCDFTFMQSEDARGIKRFIWMIYDNSIHYRDILLKGSSVQSVLKNLHV